MNSKVKRLYLHALTPIHSGIGQAVDIIDLPISREKATGWPSIPGSSLKGALRELAKDQADTLFGTVDRSGEIALTDQRILLLPVRSFYGTYAWVTSPLVLNRFSRDSQALGLQGFSKPFPFVEEHRAMIHANSKIANDGYVYLEDLDLKAEEQDSNEFSLLAQELETTLLMDHLCIVSDTIFSFLCETATEISARIKLETERKTVEPKALWWEEALPAEAFLYGFAYNTTNNGTIDLLRELAKETKVLSIGGNTTTGKGLCRWMVKP